VLPKFDFQNETTSSIKTLMPFVFLTQSVGSSSFSFENKFHDDAARKRP
jgi:hypothetical protein